MKAAFVVARVLLGLMFTVFGLNGFLHFIKMPPPTGLAATYLGALSQSHLLQVNFVIQLVTGLLLLAGVYVPLALVLLGPVLANILAYHLLMHPEGIQNALVAFVLWLVVFWSVRGNFAGVFQMRTPPAA